MKYLFAAVGLLLLFSCCHDDEEPDTTERAVLVYMAADNNLSSETNGDLSEMIAGSRNLPRTDKILLYIDKRNERPYLLELCQGDTTRLMTFKEELDCSDAATLEMAMQKMFSRYKAQHYGLVLWGHADGWVYKDRPNASRVRHAYGVDQTNGSYWMNIPDMAVALSKTPKLDFIFADCCAFQSIETAYELRHVTDYIISSPAEIPGEGAPYNTVVPAMFSDSDTFYEQMVDAYFAQTTYDGRKEPLSVIRTEAMDQLAEATRTVLASFVPQLENSRYPDVNGLIYYFCHSLFDMNDFIVRYASEDQYAAWKKALDEAVIYKTYASRWRANYVSFSDFTMSEERYSGVSMYVPQDISLFSITDTNKEIVKLQNNNISKMQWYEAVGLADLGW